jgi:hypothetical protein
MDDFRLDQTSRIHPGAQFNPEFRSLIKTEVAKLSAENELRAENDLEAEGRCGPCEALY